MLAAFARRRGHSRHGAGKGAAGFAPVRTTFHDARYDGVVAQTDWSTCGPAAVATLLRYYYGMDVDEREALRGPCRSRRRGGWMRPRAFRRLALAHSMETFGVPTLGYRLTPRRSRITFTAAGCAGDRARDPASAALRGARRHGRPLRAGGRSVVGAAGGALGRFSRGERLFRRDLGARPGPASGRHGVRGAAASRVQRLADTVWGLSALGWSVRRP